MKPATSLCSLRIVVGTRRCTNASPRIAAKLAPHTTRRPYTTLSVKGLFPLRLWRLLAEPKIHPGGRTSKQASAEASRRIETAASAESRTSENLQDRAWPRSYNLRASPLAAKDYS